MLRKHIFMDLFADRMEYIFVAERAAIC
jgi:hypothetical protein